MRKFVSTLLDVTRELMYTARYTLVSNLYNAATAIDAICPYVMYLIGQEAALRAGGMTYGWELIVPIGIGILVFYAKGVANRNNKGKSMPVPDTRFTEVSEDGEVSISQERLQELILYTADLEDWLVKRGRL